MGQKQSISFSKPETLRALQSRTLGPADPIWDDLIEAAGDPALLSQLKFEELKGISAVLPVNIAVALYRFTTSLYVLSNDKKLDINDILCHLRLITWILPPVLATEDSELLQLIIFHNGPLDTKELIKGPRKIIHPPPGAGIEAKTQDFVLRVPGPESNAHMSLAESLVSVLTGLLFLPGFTISGEAAESQNIIWGTGIGCELATKATKEMIIHRTEVLRAILSCLSSPLYHTAQDKPIDNQWLSLFVNESTNKRSWETFCSLINVSLTYDPVGWGLPYNYLLSNDDSAETLAEVSMHSLLLLLNRHQTMQSNLFQVYLQALGKESEKDFSFLYSHIVVLLNNPLQTKNSYLPNSGKAIQCNQEILLFFWTLISSNKAFMNHVLNKEDVTEVAAPIIHYILANRRNDAANGFVHLGSFTLLMLSGERKFGVQMNKAFVKKYSDSSLPSFTGSYNDLYVLTMHKLLVDCSPRLVSLHDTLLTILVNISPFITSLSMTAAMKIAKLFELFATPKNLLSNQNCHRYVQFLLETFNNLIQYQYAGNSAIVYSVVHHHQTFKNLTNLRIRSKKDSQTLQSDSGVSDDVPVRWIPTNEWLQEWKSQLPLSTTIRLINAVLADVLKLTEENKSDAEAKILEYLKTPLVGLLPVPHPILTRRYQENPGTNLWFQRYLWSSIVLHNRTIPFFGLGSIKLFKVAQAEPQGPLKEEKE